MYRAAYFGFPMIPEVPSLNPKKWVSQNFHFILVRLQATPFKVLKPILLWNCDKPCWDGNTSWHGGYMRFETPSW